MPALRVAPDDFALALYLFPPDGLQLSLLALLVYGLGLGFVPPLFGIGHFMYLLWLLRSPGPVIEFPGSRILSLLRNNHVAVFLLPDPGKHQKPSDRKSVV